MTFLHYLRFLSCCLLVEYEEGSELGEFATAIHQLLRYHQYKTEKCELFSPYDCHTKQHDRKDDNSIGKRSYECLPFQLILNSSYCLDHDGLGTRLSLFHLELIVKNAPELLLFCEFHTPTINCFLFLPELSTLCIKT